MGERLKLLAAHDALLLLRYSFSIPRVLYILCTAPSFLSSQLEAYDSVIRDIMTNMLNVSFTSDMGWKQATLPVRSGGVGVRRAVELEPSACLASAAACSEFISQILPPHMAHLPDPSIPTALALWGEGHSQPPPNSPDSFRQRVWDSIKVDQTYQMLFESALNQQARARLLAVAKPESGAWLNAFPITALGLRMDDVIRIAVGLRLGLPLCNCHQCSSCGSDVGELGTHGLSCRFSKGCHSRHAALNNVKKRALESAKVPYLLEPTGPYRSDGKRPDGVSLVPWKCGRVLVWDTTCSDTLAASHSPVASMEASAVAAEAEQRKKQKYSHLNSSHHFVPVAVETLGVFGCEAHTLFRDISCRIFSVTQDPLAHQYLIQRVVVAIQRGNAAAVLGTISYGT